MGNAEHRPQGAARGRLPSTVLSKYSWRVRTSSSTTDAGLGWRVCALVVQRERLECVWQMRMYIPNSFLLRFPLVYAPEYGVFCCQWQVFENSVFCGELQACACCSM